MTAVGPPILGTTAAIWSRYSATAAKPSSALLANSG